LVYSYDGRQQIAFLKSTDNVWMVCAVCMYVNNISEIRPTTVKENDVQYTYRRSNLALNIIQHLTGSQLSSCGADAAWNRRSRPSTIADRYSFHDLFNLNTAHNRK